MNKYFKQLSSRFPDVLSDYSTRWAEPFDFLLQEESIVIDIDNVEDLKQPEKILSKIKVANEHGYHMIRIMETDILPKFELKKTNQFICKNNEYDVIKNYKHKIGILELKEMAKKNGIPKYYSMKKEELMRYLKLI